MTSREWSERFNERWGFENPVFRREWGTFVRKALPPVAVVAALILFCSAFWIAEVSRGNVYSWEVLDVCVWAQLALACLLAPAQMASAFSQEREKKTWDLLRLSRLSVSEIWWGKFAARGAPVLVLLAGFLPLTIAAGDTGPLVILAYGVVFCSMGVAGAVALLCSACARHTYAAIAGSLATVGAWLGLLPFLVWLGDSSAFSCLYPQKQMSLCCLNPVLVMRSVLARDVSVAPALGVLVAEALLCFHLCRCVLSREGQERRIGL